MQPRGAFKNLVLLLARVLLSSTFLYTGARNLIGVERVASRLSGAGYPLPTVLAVLAALALLAGGIAVLLGVLTSLGVLALILFLVPTTYSFHLKPALGGDVGQAIQTFKNLGVAGGLLLLWVTGPGAWSVDRLRGG
jgi:putative oxidoreductase